MLENLEKAYLGILRVFILILATISLIVTISGLVSATPEILRWSGLSQSEKPKGGTLAEFIAEQKSIDSNNSSTSSENNNTLPPSILPAIKAAVANISRYPEISVDQEKLSKNLQENADNTRGHATEYADSIKDLTDELAHSTGSHLSAERVGALIEWHHDHFMTDLASKEAEQTAAQSSMLVKLGFAASAFVAFIMMIFVFIFVKIERNLRTLKTIAAKDFTHE